MLYKEAIASYLQEQSFSSIQLKAVLFDMDGVLFNSMPHHARAWHKAMLNQGLDLKEEEAYLHEGRTGAGTINIVFNRELGRTASEKEIKDIYSEKSSIFNSYPEAKPMPGAKELLNKIREDGLFSMVVTGSGQTSLLEKLDSNFPGTFKKELMVTAFDVEKGKPDPEPYLMALHKGGLTTNEAIVVENAPLGVEAAVAAGIFTIAVNTGPLNDDVLLKAGANILFKSMEELNDKWKLLYHSMCSSS